MSSVEIYRRESYVIQTVKIPILVEKSHRKAWQSFDKISIIREDLTVVPKLLTHEYNFE